ncbi:heavy metal translocating P-type ATPase [Pectinatus haikarae]|uniref:Cd(2+)-exporting ATPase n=1 Tax=Pectinatus haikarae TaxID=349096 RepID=A0ABT9Y5E1_9FIRM|nr:cation-translocating P-type ATPase [Pectinatus haikarae]MDQ0203043.1 heavy metal translocating P-type ATPase [Pectinatus haikarae]
MFYKLRQNKFVSKDIIFLIISSVSLLLSFLNAFSFSFDMAWIAIFLCGIPIIREAASKLISSFDIKADILVSIALIASVSIGEFFAAGEIALIMKLGSLLEEITVARAKAGIENLLHLTPQTARKILNGQEMTISAEKVAVDDILRVFPGEMISVDGIIVSGTTSVDQAVMTGESLPVDKNPGDTVLSGTTNLFGSFDMKATRVGNDSSIQRIVQLVRSADAGKAKIVGLADRWATWIVIAALITSLLTWFITGEIIRAVTILVVFCPCALVLATPTAIVAAIGNATKHNILIKNGDALERLASVSKIVFDKTGTLTCGSLQLSGMQKFSSDYTEDELFTYAATIESRSEHPLGKAMVSAYYEKPEQNLFSLENFQIFPGRGLQATINGKNIIAGNIRMLSEQQIHISRLYHSFIEKYLTDGYTIIYMAVDGILAAIFTLTDTLRPDIKKTIASIKECGFTTALLTGDNEYSAKNAAVHSGVDSVHANCLPADKLKQIDTYQQSGNKICMIGDGVNDAPALKKAFVGIAMGETGSDIAIDAADITLINDSIKEVPHLLYLAKKMMTTIKFNLTFSMLLNFLAVIMAATGFLDPVAGALVHNAGSVFVIINSSLLLNWHKKDTVHSFI